MLVRSEQRMNDNCKHFKDARYFAQCIWCRGIPENKTTPMGTPEGDALWYFAQDIIELTNGKENPREKVPMSHHIWGVIEQMLEASKE